MDTVTLKVSSEQIVQPFSALLTQFECQFNQRKFPATPPNLYDSMGYILAAGGKRVRPVLCLMGNELFGTLHPDAFLAANAVELFHTFSLVHDDIMDRAPVRRGMPTIHARYNEPTAILAGDLLLIYAYEYLNGIQHAHKQQITTLFNETARGICEGQQMDMDFESIPAEQLPYAEYLDMISLKTSVLLAASLQMGAIIGNAKEQDQRHLYAFGKNVGIAFQIQDDYLDVFDHSEKFGKEPGGDIRTNKRTFLLLKALELCTPLQRRQLQKLLETDNNENKVAQVMQLYKECHVDDWAKKEKEHFQETAFRHLDKIAMPSLHKQPLRDLAVWLLNRQY